LLPPSLLHLQGTNRERQEEGEKEGSEREGKEKNENEKQQKRGAGPCDQARGFPLVLFEHPQTPGTCPCLGSTL